MDLRDKAAQLPLSPGVYLYEDAGGRVIYAGKAKGLRLAIHRAFENAVVIRIGRHHAEDAARDDNARGLGDHADHHLHAVFPPCEIAPQNLGHLPDNRRRDHEFVAPIDSRIPNGGIAALRVRERGDVDIRIEDGFKLKFRGAQVHTMNPTATINKGTFDALRIARVIQEDDRQDHAAAPTGRPPGSRRRSNRTQDRTSSMAFRILRSRAGAPFGPNSSAMFETRSPSTWNRTAHSKRFGSRFGGTGTAPRIFASTSIRSSSLSSNLTAALRNWVRVNTRLPSGNLLT